MQAYAGSARGYLVDYANGKATTGSERVRDLASPVRTGPIAPIQTDNRLARIISMSGSELEHPWRGVNVVMFQPTDLVRLRSDLETVERSGTNVSKAVNGISSAFELPVVCIGDIPFVVKLLQIVADRPDVNTKLLKVLGNTPDLQRIARTMTFGKELSQILRELDDAVLAEAWEIDFADVKSGLDSGRESWVSRLKRPYRSASKKLSLLLAIPMPKGPEARLMLVNDFMRAQELRREIENEHSFCRKYLGESWRGLRTDFNALEKGLMWINSLAELSIAPSLERCATFNGITPRVVTSFRELVQQFSADIGKLRTLEIDAKIAFGVRDIYAVPTQDFVERVREWLAHFNRIEEWIDLGRADTMAHADAASRDTAV